MRFIVLVLVACLHGALGLLVWRTSAQAPQLGYAATQPLAVVQGALLAPEPLIQSPSESVAPRTVDLAQQQSLRRELAPEPPKQERLAPPRPDKAERETVPESPDLSGDPPMQTALENAEDAATNPASHRPESAASWAGAESAVHEVSVPPSPAAFVQQNQPPRYPLRSRRRGEEGTVVLALRIDASGQVVRAHIQQSSGYHRLDQAAREAVLAWRYTPAQRMGRAVAADYVQPMVFSLQSSG